MKIAVTGGKGFIGSHLLQYLNEEFAYAETVALAKYDEIEALKKFKPDILFHLGGRPLVKDASLELIDSNVNLTYRLLKHVPEGCKFILASSATVYGNCDLGVRNELHSYNPSSIYGASKVAAEQLVLTAGKLGWIKPVILRYVANVGANATHGVLPDFVRKLQENTDELEILGEYPGPFKPYMHVHDTVSASLRIALSKHTGIFNVSPLKCINLVTLATSVMQEMGVLKPMRWTGKSSWVGDDRYIEISPAKLLSIGWKPKYPCSVDAIKQATRDILNAQLRG